MKNLLITLLVLTLTSCAARRDAGIREEVEAAFCAAAGVQTVDQLTPEQRIYVQTMVLQQQNAARQSDMMRMQYALSASQGVQAASANAWTQHQQRTQHDQQMGALRAIQHNTRPANSGPFYYAPY